MVENVLKRIEEKCRRAKKEIQSGFYGRPLKNPQRQKITLQELPFGNLYLFGSDKRLRQNRNNQPVVCPKNRHYDISDYRQE